MSTRVRRPASRYLLLAVGGLCLVLVLGDVLVGSWLESKVADRIGCRFGAEGADVDVSGWPASWPLVSGTLPRVRVSAQDAELVDGLSGDLAVDLHDVDRGGDGLSTGGGDAVLTVRWADVAKRLDRPGVSFSGDDGAVVAQLETGLLPVAVVARPEVDGGRLTLDPVGVRLGDRELSGAFADRLLGRLGGGPDLLGQGLDLPTRSGLTLEGVAGEEDGLRLTFTVPSGQLGRGLGAGRCSA